ncbi:DUF6507 family protein [Paenarthrobacter sp. NPDC057981]|uniref:DUF6507 family protein n=1 Tax=Paenarthrobacter sp. NPDC057981 TaxID=3346297 RepID=UPI0036D7C3EA
MFEIDSGRALAVVAASRQRITVLPGVQSQLRHAFDALGGVLRSGPAYSALQYYADSVLITDVRALVQRTANIFGGAQAAVAAYVACDETMAATALANARSTGAKGPWDFPPGMSWNPAR